jgi:hypothetical protein
VPPSETPETADAEKQCLYELDECLRSAIGVALATGHIELGVALDDTRNYLESVLLEEAPSPSRIFIAKVRAEMALATYRALCAQADEKSRPT